MTNGDGGFKSFTFLSPHFCRSLCRQSVYKSQGNVSLNWMWFLWWCDLSQCEVFSHPTFLNPMHKATKSGCTHLNMTTQWNECHSVADFYDLLIVLFLRLTSEVIHVMLLGNILKSMTCVRQSTMHVLGPCCTSPWTLFLFAAQIPQLLDSLPTTHIWTAFLLLRLYILLNSRHLLV